MMSLTKNIFYIMMAWLLWLISSHLKGIHGYNDRSVRVKTSSRLRPTQIDIREKLIEWQCYAKCSVSNNVSSFQACKSQCKVDVFTTPRRGQCPQTYLNAAAGNELFLKLACLDECKVDFDCPEVQKCCASACGGPICLDAVGVNEDMLLPPIPKILHLKLPKGHKVEITIQTSANTTIYYHVETRYHIGQQFSSRKLGLWQWQPVEMTAEEILENKKKRIQLCFNLKPGRWYQVRIAAINSYGFRGYSEPSKAFTLSKHPRPPFAPTDLQVVDANFNGKYYAINIAWCPSRSNLPVEKYKIIWSLYVKSTDESIISNEAVVRDTHQFEITNLLPDSSYYIQVLAMCINGNHRLKSDKISILFNSTISEFRRNPHRCWQPTHTSQNSLTRNKLQIPEHLRANVIPSISTNTTALYDVRFRLNQKFGMIVQITGFQPDKQKVYELCYRDTSCEHKKYSAIRAKKHSLEFNKLKYNTIYFLKEVEPVVNSEVQKNQKGVKTHNYFSFKTPKCENLRKRFPKMQIKC